MSIWPSRSCSDYAVYILLIVFVYYHGHINVCICHVYVMHMLYGGKEWCNQFFNEPLSAIAASAE